MRIVIGAPGNGAALKDALKTALGADERVEKVIDLSEPHIQYPEVSFKTAHAILQDQADRGILICGTGLGTSIAANKVAGIRAATAHDLVSVRGSIENYDAQILCMGQNIIAAPAAIALLDVWLDLTHDPQSNYHPRLGEISEYETGAVN